MLSTFHGLETAKRGLSTQQAGLHTTGHNISNANTEGYSRQRTNMTASDGFPNAAFNRPGIPGQMGTGVQANDVQRVREAFLDVQYRAENNDHGYWDAKHEALYKMEDVMNEPTDDGLTNTMDEFWNALQDLSSDPEDSGARSVVRQRGEALAETFNYKSDSLEQIQSDYGNELSVNEDDINSILYRLDAVNTQIAEVEPHGDLPNDLYDQRDLLVDELSGHINISVERNESGGNAKDSAEGAYTIHMVDNDGEETGIELIDGENLDYNQIALEYADDGAVDAQNPPVTGVSFTNEALVNTDYDTDELTNADGESREAMAIEDFFQSSGSLAAKIEAYGYAEGGAENPDLANVQGDFPEMMAKLDEMITTFAAEFNEVHESGWSLAEIADGEKANGGDGIPFFTFADGANAAQNVRVSDAVRDSTDNIAASAAADDGEAAEEAFAGDGSNALALANVKDAELDFDGDTTDVQSYYQGVIGEMAVKTNEAERMKDNTGSLLESVKQNRDSVSSVSLDEEMTDMIQFQHAYNAAARSITAVDEMLDRIINQMGIVGR
ncbi:flagellar hook-associated protein FlgK [Salisediminibacterium halotolerans]|uniref:flagellar hook-associated protein FlgK n=1 Tax=Salisediminibacterium halotolerans TaxID=517425 RepID=UPI000EB205B5|nr:flagellar hook-associated protein FlgK [Salisediminibacterium halotolerans]RLJ75543.1 flagellar hook-associated protein 1 FlgK [Actinophytocola xinjiangensis]RPE89396.1 flagellar hook-associated protein 1 FlgK [Salisediminibacterium halotolerans]TWG36156.1 flagellar hook-associated protein 1 FlgK [Salisediminibacterium halotolerans]GEL07633.1 flagellar hook-associated protein 1 [Salisediminibacterium halotolerans]